MRNLIKDMDLKTKTKDINKTKVKEPRQEVFSSLNIFGGKMTNIAQVFPGDIILCRSNLSQQLQSIVKHDK